MQYLQIRKKGFTLAEVLVTLAVIGVVASMTIPSLLKNQQDIQLKTALQKAYSDLSNAINSEIAQNGIIWGRIAGSNGWEIWDALADKLKFLEYCEDSAYSCTLSMYKEDVPMVDAEGTLYQNSTQTGGHFKNYAVLENGTYLSTTRENDCSLNYASPLLCYKIEVDVNGSRKPNQIGRDYFHFYLLRDSASNYKLLPAGSPMIPSGLTGYSYNEEHIKCTGNVSRYSIGCAYPVLYNKEIPWDPYP